jgi:hypothetical protein
MSWLKGYPDCAMQVHIVLSIWHHSSLVSDAVLLPDVRAAAHCYCWFCCQLSMLW